jgi:hypothetical protein
VDLPGLSGLAGTGGSGFLYLWEPGIRH